MANKKKKKEKDISARVMKRREGDGKETGEGITETGKVGVGKRLR